MLLKGGEKDLKYRPDRSLAFAAVEGLAPGMSPNVFASVRDAMVRQHAPTVIEIGLGVSTYHFIALLLGRGGTYIGIEHNRGWFEIVELWIRRLLTGQAKRSPVEETRVIGALQPRYSEKPMIYVDSSFRTAHVAVHLRLRQSPSITGDGTEEEFHEYLEAVRGPANVVIIDGRARASVIKRVVESSLLTPGGMLVVHDAHEYEAAIDAYAPGGTYMDGVGGFGNAFVANQPVERLVPREAYVWTAPLQVAVGCR